MKFCWFATASLEHPVGAGSGCEDSQCVSVGAHLKYNQPREKSCVRIVEWNINTLELDARCGMMILLVMLLLLLLLLDDDEGDRDDDEILYR